MNCQVMNCDNNVTHVMKEDYHSEKNNLVTQTEKMLCKKHASIISHYESSDVSIETL